MSVNRTPISRTRTLLIILGIVLAFILTWNASSLFSAENSLKMKDRKEKLNSPTKPSGMNGKIESAGLSFVHILMEKFTTLK